MLFYLFITLLISVYAYFDWKKAVIIWLPVSMLFNPCVCIRYAPPALTVTLVVNAVLLSLYLIREKERNFKLCNGPFCFRNVFVFYLISYGLSMLFSIVPFTTVLTGTIQYFLNTFIILFLFHKALKTSADIKLFLKAALLVFVPIVLLGLYEATFHDNPWLDYVYMSVPDFNYITGKMFYKPPFLSYLGDLSIRYGMVRCYSFFNIHIAFGCACLLYLFFFLFSIRQGYKEGIFLSNYTYVAISFLCVVGIILSNSKTPMVGLPFFVLAAIPPKSLFSVKGIAITGIVALCIVVILSYSSNLFNNFIALFDMKMQEEGGGSTANLRAKQYSIGWELFSISPLFGNGIGSLGYFLSHSTRYSDILGSESSWLKILPQQGVLGVVAYLYLYKELYGSLKKSAGEYTAIFYCIGLILMETATGFMDMMVFAPAVIVIERYHQLRLQREEILCNKLLRSSIVKENVK